MGIESLLSAIVERIPSPYGLCRREESLRALLYDSWYDPFKVFIQVK